MDASNSQLHIAPSAPTIAVPRTRRPLVLVAAILVPLLGRLATVGPDGVPHVAPVGWSLGPDEETIVIGGRDFAVTKKFRDVARTGKAAIVIDEVLPPWRPRAVEVRSNAQAVAAPEPHIVIHPTRVISWGLDQLEKGG